MKRVRSRIWTFLPAALSVTTLCTRVLAQPDGPDATAEQEIALDDQSPDPDLEHSSSWDWLVEVKPMVWIPGFRGDLKMPHGSSVDIESLNADETRVTPAGRISITTEGWTIRFRAFGFSLEEDNFSQQAFTLANTPVANGERVSTDINFSSVDLTAGFRVWNPVEDIENDVRLGFDLYGGIRLHSMDVQVRSTSATSQFDENWFQPIVGVRMNIDLPRGFGVEASTDLGAFFAGEDSSTSFDITAAFTWRYHNTIGAEIGFRHHQFNLIAGDGPDKFEYDGSLAGLYAALVIRF